MLSRLLAFVAIATSFINAAVPAGGYQCWNLKSTDEIRHEYLTVVNKLRKQIADGTADNKDQTKCPQGKNIYRLEWDCLIEMQAEKAVEQCSETPNNMPKELSAVVSKVPLTTCNPKPLFKQTVNGWWDVVKQVGVESPPVFKDQKLANFAKLAYGKATRIGCAQKNCGSDLYIACMLDPVGPADGELIYEPGAGCQSAKDCDTYAGSKCSGNVCRAGYIDPTATTTTVVTTTSETTPGQTTPGATTPGATTPNPAPSTTTTTTPPTTTTTPATTTSTAPPDATTMCPENAHISRNGVRKTFVNLHNNHRRELVNELVQNGNSGTKLRPGSKMMEIKYDCEAERTAFEWAKQCIDADSPASSRRNWGENRYTFPNKNLDLTTVATRASNRWWVEIANARIDQSTNTYHANQPIAHFVKMAWDTHEYLGCAIYYCPSFINAVCHYGPAGQFGAGKQIYKVGPKCNRCGTVGARCRNGLCFR